MSRLLSKNFSGCHSRNCRFRSSCCAFTILSLCVALSAAHFFVMALNIVSIIIEVVVPVAVVGVVVVAINGYKIPSGAKKVCMPAV